MDEGTSAARAPHRRPLPQRVAPHPQPQRLAPPTPGKDARSLALLLLLSLAQLWSQRGLLRIPQLAAATAGSAAVVAALVCALTRPDAYRRRRQSIVAALRILLGIGALWGGSSLELLAAATQPAAGRPLLQALPHFLLLLAWESGTLLLAQVRACSARGWLSASSPRLFTILPLLELSLFRYCPLPPTRVLPHPAAGRLEPGAAAAAGHGGPAGWSGCSGKPQRRHLRQPLPAAARQPPAHGSRVLDPAACSGTAGAAAGGCRAGRKLPFSTLRVR